MLTNLRIDKLPPGSIKSGWEFIKHVSNVKLRVLHVLQHCGFTGDEVISRDDVLHYGRKGQKWGVRNGPPYPLRGEGLKAYKIKALDDNTGLKKEAKLTVKWSSDDHPKWSKKEQEEAFDYWSIQDDKIGYPRRLKTTGFSSKDTLTDHFVKHGQRMGFESEEAYEIAGKDFFHSPRGEYGDAHVKKNGDACRYDYETGEFAVVSKTGKLKSYWNLIEEKGTDKAEMYWKRQLNE